jgi:hypothetical protein
LVHPVEESYERQGAKSAKKEVGEKATRGYEAWARHNQFTLPFAR